MLKSDFEAARTLKENFGGYLLKCLDRAEDSRLVNGTSCQSLSYGEVARQARAVARGLLHYGIKKGDVVCLITDNCLQVLPAVIGIACVNGIATYSGRSIEDTVDHLDTLEAVAIFASPSNIAKALSAKKRSRSVKHLFVFGNSEEPGCVSWERLTSLRDGDNVTLDYAYLPRHPCYMPITSGTTGKPKVAVHTHDSLLATLQAVSHPKHMPLNRSDVLMCTTSLIHVYALFDCVCKAIVQGASAVFLEHCTEDAVSEAIHAHKVTSLHTSPYVAKALLHSPRLEDDNTLNYFTTASTYIPETVAQELFTRLKLKNFAQLYGQTEIPFATAGVYGERPRLSSIGKVASGVEAMIQDTETEKPLGPDQRGELLLRGPGLLIGYYGKMDKPVTDSRGWYKTGDICYYDEDGYIYLVDRRREFVKVRSSSVSPVAVEMDVIRCPLVKDCAVVGIPDPKTEQALHAIVVPSSPEVTAEDIHKFMTEHAPGFHRLEGGITFADVIPRNALGKFVRKELLQWVLDRRSKGQ